MDAEKGSLSRSLVLYVPTLAGIAAATSLLVDYLRPVPVFCDPDGGCAALRHTLFASFLGFPTPEWGLAGFLLIGVLGLLRGRFARAALLGVAAVGALVAGFLLSVQARFDTWCPFCVVSDTSSCLVFFAALWRAVSGWDPPASPRIRGSLAGLLVPVIAAPLLIGSVRAGRKPVIPEVIAGELQKTPKGQVTLIDFADFECPFCRMTHAALAPLVAAHHDQVRVVRKNVPLSMHKHAMDAARAACCGEEMGKGEVMADALFSAPVDDLTPDGCAKLAASLGLDEDAFRKCTTDPATDEHIKADQAAFKASHGRGLPTLWFGEEKIEGAQSEDQLEEVLTRAIAARS
jgi:protein-disulfide isomerase/uncharacterized membrane protein